MNIEEHGFCWSSALYWLLVAILALLLFLFTGTPKTGSGSGSGSGGGDGMGYGTIPGGTGDGAGYGSGASKTGAGTGDGESAVGNGQNDAGSAQNAPANPPSDTPSDAPQDGASTGGTSAKQTENPPEPFASMALPFSQPDKGTPATAPKAGGREKGFFGVDVVPGARVIFLVDRSGSMSNGTAEQISRQELLKRELLKVITAMSQKKPPADPNQKRSILEDPVGKFRIAIFDDQFELAPAAGQKIWSFGNASDIKKATDFIMQVSPRGGTEMLMAWQHLKPTISADRITVVYFLSDGAFDDGDQLLLYLKQNHPHLVIHTFSMGRHSPLMEEIARQHNGTYVKIR